MDKKFWAMFSLLSILSFILIIVGMHIYHLDYINDAQLGYAGAIIGGSMTLIGVWWTIMDQEKQRRKDLENSFLPVPIITDKDIEYSPNFEYTTLSVTLTFQIKNVGNSPIINIQDEGAYLESTIEKVYASEYGDVFDGHYVIEINSSSMVLYPKISVKVPSETSIVNAVCIFSYEDSFGNKTKIEYCFPFKIIPNKSIVPLDVKQKTEPI